MAGVLDLRLDGRLVQAVKVRCLGFHDLISAQRQRPGGGDAVLVCPDGIHQVSGPGVVDLELGVGDGSPGRPAVHGVVVRRGLGHLDLSSDGRVLPDDFRSGAIGDVDGLELLIHDISLILQLPQVVAAGAGQVVDVDIAAII